MTFLCIYNFFRPRKFIFIPCKSILSEAILPKQLYLFLECGWDLQCKLQLSPNAALLSSAAVSSEQCSYAPCWCGPNVAVIPIQLSPVGLHAPCRCALFAAMAPNKAMPSVQLLPWHLCPQCSCVQCSYLQCGCAPCLCDFNAALFNEDVPTESAVSSEDVFPK